jgi:REP element-mobilizing transposase RayT
MPRKNLIRSKIHPYHVTVRCNNREIFHCDLDFVWKIFNQEFVKILENYHPRIHAFVLMPNHFHLLISTPDQDLGVIMQNLISPITKILNFKASRSGRVFGARYHWSLIDSENYYDCALKYIYRNPIKAGLCKTALEYPFSTYRSHFGHEKLPFSIEPAFEFKSIIPNEQKDDFNNWINQPFSSEHEKAIKFAFGKSTFSPPRNLNSKKRIKLEEFTTNYCASPYQKVSDT